MIAMATETGNTIAELGPEEETLAGTVSGEDKPPAPTQTPDPGTAPQPSTSSPRRSGIPPKRPGSAAKRQSIVPGSAAKPTISSPSTASRTAAGSSLSKPPTRPIAAAARRPPNTATPSGATASVHKPKPSTSSITSTEDGKKSSVMSQEGENKKPTISGSARRISIAPSAVTKTTAAKTPAASSTDRRSTMGSSTLSDTTNSTGKIPSSRPSISSPSKGEAKATANMSKSTSSLATARTARTPLHSSRILAGKESTDAGKKRLSTIPASPAPGAAEPSAGKDASKPTRPQLSQRKSTMSVTIEQRLREMELVSEMLKVAMAEDGDNEELEEFGNKADETLASLKQKLEEARINEGKQPFTEAELQGEPSVNGISKSSLGKGVSGDEDTEKLRSELATSQATVGLFLR